MVVGCWLLIKRVVVGKELLSERSGRKGVQNGVQKGVIRRELLGRSCQGRSWRGMCRKVRARKVKGEI